MNQIYKNKNRVESYFRDKNLLYENVVHYPYEKTLGANYYVTKSIGIDKIEWGAFGVFIRLSYHFNLPSIFFQNFT